MDDLEEAAENIHILVREELEVQHHFEGHPTAIADCPICARHDRSIQRASGGRTALGDKMFGLHRLTDSHSGVQ